MGTNFYFSKCTLRRGINPLGQPVCGDTNDMDPAIHLGKRSAASFWCWDCGATLCKEGPEGVHKGVECTPRNECGGIDWAKLFALEEQRWYDRCTCCGQAPVDETLDTSSGGVELGFAQPRQQRPTGVQSCASFSWAQPPEAVMKVCRRYPKRKLVVDEYGRQYTGWEFLEMLEHNCPIEFTDSIGVWFS